MDIHLLRKNKLPKDIKTMEEIINESVKSYTNILKNWGVS